LYTLKVNIGLLLFYQNMPEKYNLVFADTKLILFNRLIKIEKL